MKMGRLLACPYSPTHLGSPTGPWPPLQLTGEERAPVVPGLGLAGTRWVALDVFPPLLSHDRQLATAPSPLGPWFLLSG